MSIVLKDIPDDLREKLEQEASANLRSVDEEALARLKRSFEDESVNTARDQQWIDEALASGPAQPKTQADWHALRDRVLKRGK